MGVAITTRITSPGLGKGATAAIFAAEGSNPPLIDPGTLLEICKQQLSESNDKLPN
jgi:hypothetical protein